MAETTIVPKSNSFLGGIFDGLGTILDKVSPAATAYLNNQAAQNQVDAYGRKPGQLGYGTAVAPAGFSTASTMPAWVKPVAIGGGILLLVLLAWKLLTKK